MIEIGSEGLTAVVNPQGAELWSLKDAEGRELMTDADPAFWTGRAPLLFPIVGRLMDDKYRIDGKVVEQFPMTLDELERAEPIYEIFPGWSEDISGATRLEDLPDNARRYIDAIQRLVDVQISLLSVGPGRDETITLVNPFAG